MRLGKADMLSTPGLLSRRTFLLVSTVVGGGLLVGWTRTARAARLIGAAGTVPRPDEVALTPWVRFTPDNRVTIVVSQAELGHGISTTLPAILADELGADWESVRLETAPYAPAYRNPARAMDVHGKQREHPGLF
jgi:isoquinoline 1-oxidoreductase beta subunit